MFYVVNIKNNLFGLGVLIEDDIFRYEDEMRYHLELAISENRSWYEQ